MRARLALAALLLAAPAALPSLARAESVQRSDPAGDLRKVRGLTTAEKLSLDIFRVKATRSLGLLVVEVRYRSSLEARLGRGHLRNAMAGIVLTSKTGKSVVVGTVGRERTLRHVVGVPRRPRGAAALPRAAVARAGRIFRFYVSGYDLDSLRGVRAATHSGRARRRDARAAAGTDALSWFFLHVAPWGDKSEEVDYGVPQPPDTVRDCRTLRTMIEGATKDYDHFQRYAWIDDNKEAAEAVKRWIDAARARLDELCQAPGGPDVGNPQPGNTAPTASFSFSPANNPPAAPRAGSSVSFTGTASDPDGSVVSWTWNFGDGTSQSGTGPAPAASHIYDGAGGYNASLTVTDDRGTTYTTATQLVKVSGPGSKTSRVFSEPFDTLECELGVHTFHVWVPSWAQPAYNVTWNDELCPAATKTVSTADDPGGVPPAGEETDAHGQPTKRVRITVMITAASGPDTTAQLTLSWN